MEAVAGLLDAVEVAIEAGACGGHHQGLGAGTDWHAVSETTSPTPQKGPAMPEVAIPCPDDTMTAHLARPTGTGPWPGVLVVHDALGYTTDVRNQAEWLAGNGYLALAPDLYHRTGRLRCLVATMRDLAAGNGPSFDDLEAARRWLEQREECTGRIGVIGFCMGGGFALMLAGTGQYAVSSVNYGMIDDADEILAESCPVVASFGAEDRSLREAPAELERVLTLHGVEHDIKTYDGAGHGFLNNHAKGETPLWAGLAGRLVNTDYHGAAAKDARARILSFFDRNLSTGS